MKLTLPLAAAVLFAVAACSTDEATPAPTPAPSAAVSHDAQPAPSGSAHTNGYPYGFDTYYVASRRDIPPGWGHPSMWPHNAERDGYQVGTTPKQGAIACTVKGAYSTVAYVESVNADGTVELSAMNYKGTWGTVSRRTEDAKHFTYIY